MATVGVLLAIAMVLGVLTGPTHAGGQLRFEEGVADGLALWGHSVEGPEDTLVRSGIKSFKLGDLDGAIQALSQVRASRRHPEARLYLALAHLLKRDNRRADEELTIYRQLTANPFLRAQVERVLAVIREDPLTDGIRRLIAGPLEHEADRDRQERVERTIRQVRSRVFPPML